MYDTQHIWKIARWLSNGFVLVAPEPLEVCLKKDGAFLEPKNWVGFTLTTLVDLEKFEGIFVGFFRMCLNNKLRFVVWSFCFVQTTILGNSFFFFSSILGKCKQVIFE